MRRREFITLLSGGARVAARCARATTEQCRSLGFSTARPGTGAMRHTCQRFPKGLNEAGYIDGRNVAIEYRWAEGQSDRLPAMAADLVRRQVAVIAATSTPAALAAKAATTTIPDCLHYHRRSGAARPCNQP